MNETEHCKVLISPSFSTAEKLIFLIVNLFTAFIAIFGNCLVITVVFLNSKLQTRSVCFLVFLSVTDFITGVLVQPLSMAIILRKWDNKTNCYLSMFLAFIATIMCGSSASMLTLISYDRYMHLSKLNNYSVHMTSFKIKILLIAVSMYPALTGIFMFTILSSVFYYLVIIESLLLMIIMCFCYYKSWKIVKNQALKRTQSKENKRLVDRHWKVAKSMVILITFYFLAWTPLTVFTAFDEIRKLFKYDLGIHDHNKLCILYFCLLCGFANAAVNPFIYFQRNSKLRKPMATLLNKILCSACRVAEIELLNENDNVNASNTGNLNKNGFCNNVFLNKIVENKEASLQLNLKD
ncbi:adenosine receptor A3-like [Hydra vulgaris]|uniref:Adenosine receptor A3-like n=1 Tax=Hydra vulgaris TaxID=6087 RepID=A0ABM4DKB8_HYDVU